MTTRDFLKDVITLAESANNEEVATKAKELVAALDKRNASRAAKPSKTAIANAPIKEAIHGLLVNGGKMTSADIGVALTITPQKASALCRQMVESGILKSEEVKVPKKGKVKAYSIVE